MESGRENHISLLKDLPCQGLVARTVYMLAVSGLAQIAEATADTVNTYSQNGGGERKKGRERKGKG